MGKYCVGCGNSLADDDLFCRSCGTKQETVGVFIEGQVENDAVVKAEMVITDPVPELDSSLYADKTKRGKKPLIFAIGSVAAVCIITVLVIFFLGGNKGLVAVDKMEQLIDEAYIKVIGAYDENYKGVKQVEIKNVNEKTHDQTFNCFVMPSEDGVTGLRVMGLVKNGQVIQLQSIYIGMEDDFNQLDAEAQIAFMTMIPYPISIFKEDLDTVQEIANFLDDMRAINSDTSGLNKMRTVEGDIEYTYTGGTGSGVAIFSFNIRYLPAFSSGFFEDNGDTSLFGESPFLNNGNNNMNAEGDTLTAFLNMAGGIWIDLTTCRSLTPEEDDVLFSFCGIEEGNLYFAVYPGGGDRIGEIVNVIKKENFKYILTLFYPEEEWMGDYYEEEYITCGLIFDGNSFFFENYPEIIYTYMGSDLDDARKNAIKYYKKQS